MFVRNSATTVELGDSKFDIAAIGDWVGENVWLCLLFAAVAFIFWLFRKQGFAEKLLEYRLRGREIDASNLEASRRVSDVVLRKFDRDDPLLPLERRSDGERK